MRKLLTIIILFALLLTIRNILLSVRKASENQQIISDLKENVDRKKAENEFLKQKLYYVKSNEYVEKEAREKLGLVKNGEYMVLAPLPKSNSNQEAKKEEKPNILKWKDMIF